MHFIEVALAEVQRSDLAVSAEVGRRNLKGDLVVGEFVHLFCQIVGLSHQGVGLHYLLPEPRKTLTEQLVPDNTDRDAHRHTSTHNKIQRDHSVIKMWC